MILENRAKQKEKALTDEISMLQQQLNDEHSSVSIASPKGLKNATTAASCKPVTDINTTK